MGCHQPREQRETKAMTVPSSCGDKADAKRDGPMDTESLPRQTR